MAMLAVCPSCGHKNPMGRMFCMQCGSPMSAARPESKPEVSIGQRMAGLLGRLVRLALTFALLYLICMMLWPVTPAGMTGNIQDAQQVVKKLGQLKAAEMDDKSLALRISEVELNARLAEILNQNQPASSADGYNYRMTQVNLALEENLITVTLRAALGPVDLSYQVVGQPVADGQDFQFQVREARLGHLSMPGPLRGWMAGKVAVVFSAMLDERSILDQLDRLVVGQGEVEVANVGR